MIIIKKSKFLNNFESYINNPLNHKFNKSNIKKFLNACDDETRPLAKKIIDNTKFISFKEMIKYLNKNIEELNNFIKKDRPIFLFINKNDDNKWIYLYFNNYVQYKYPNREIILLTDYVINNDKMINDDTIVFMEDCITNSQILNNLLSLINKNNLKLNIFILSPFITKNAEFLINILTLSNNYKLIFNSHMNYIPIITDYLNYKEIELLTSYYTNYNEKYPINSYYFEIFMNKYLIIFDYKINDFNLTLPLFYRGIVPNSHNKKLFNNATINIPNNLEIIPL